MSTLYRDTKQKRAIWTVLEAAHRPLSPTQVQEAVLQELPAVSLATVYRVIKGFVEEGRLVPVSFPGAPDRYETKACAAHHHHHFLCTSCGRAFDLPGCGLKVSTGLPEGFAISRHEVVLYGSCDKCLEAAIV